MNPSETYTGSIPRCDQLKVKLDDKLININTAAGMIFEGKKNYQRMIMSPEDFALLKHKVMVLLKKQMNVPNPDQLRFRKLMKDEVALEMMDYSRVVLSDGKNPPEEVKGDSMLSMVAYGIINLMYAFALYNLQPSLVGFPALLHAFTWGIRRDTSKGLPNSIIVDMLIDQKVVAQSTLEKYRVAETLQKLLRENAEAGLSNASDYALLLRTRLKMVLDENVVCIKSKLFYVPTFIFNTKFEMNFFDLGNAYITRRGDVFVKTREISEEEKLRLLTARCKTSRLGRRQQLRGTITDQHTALIDGNICYFYDFETKTVDMFRQLQRLRELEAHSRLLAKADKDNPDHYGSKML